MAVPRQHCRKKASEVCLMAKHLKTLKSAQEAMRQAVFSSNIFFIKPSLFFFLTPTYCVLLPTHFNMVWLFTVPPSEFTPYPRLFLPFFTKLFLWCPCPSSKPPPAR